MNKIKFILYFKYLMNDNEKLAIYILSGITFLSGCIAIILGCILTPRVLDNDDSHNQNTTRTVNNTNREVEISNSLGIDLEEEYHSRDITRIDNNSSLHQTLEEVRQQIQSMRSLEKAVEEDKNEEEEIMMTFSPSYFVDFRPLEEVSETEF